MAVGVRGGECRIWLSHAIDQLVETWIFLVGVHVIKVSNVTKRFRVFKGSACQLGRYWDQRLPSLLSSHNCGWVLALTIKLLLCRFLSPIGFWISGSSMGVRYYKWYQSLLDRVFECWMLIHQRDSRTTWTRVPEDGDEHSVLCSSVNMNICMSEFFLYFWLRTHLPIERNKNEEERD